MKRRVLLNKKGNDWDGTVAPSFAYGTGSSSDPYIVSKPSELAYLVNKVLGTKTFYAKIVDDLDLNNIEWSAIATKQINYNYYTHIEGNGHMIKNLKYNGGNYSALFPGEGKIDISNLGVISGEINIGSGYICGTFCARSSYGNFTNLFSRANIKAPSSIYGYIGGILGYGSNAGDIGYANITNCYFAGTISCPKYNDGICSVKLPQTSVSNSYNCSTINPNSIPYGGYKSTDKTSQEMKSSSFVSLLGSAFIQDVKGINDGYPILKEKS